MSELKISKTLSDKFSVKRNEDSTSHEMVVTFDCSNVNDAQATDVFLAALRVKYQGKLRKLSEKELAEMAGKEVKVDVVADILTRQQALMTPERAVEKMTDEEAAKVLALLQERLGKK